VIGKVNVPSLATVWLPCDTEPLFYAGELCFPLHGRPSDPELYVSALEVFPFSGQKIGVPIFLLSLCSLPPCTALPSLPAALGSLADVVSFFLNGVASFPV